jgi:hypothetical protein
MHVNKTLHWLHMLHCIILLCGHEHNTLRSKRMCLMFLPCGVGPFSDASPVLVTHVIQFRINPLINPPDRLLTVNVWDVICIWARYGDIINPLRRWARTINRSISLTYWNSWWCRDVVVFILGAVCELVGREGRGRSLMTFSLCGKWGGTTTSVVFVVTTLTIFFSHNTCTWTREINSLHAPTLDPSPPSIPATMDETKQMYHTKFKKPLRTSNTCIFHYLHSYTWHTNESITSSHRSAGKSPNNRCKVPTNQESNSLAPRNHA